MLLNQATPSTKKVVARLLDKRGYKIVLTLKKNRVYKIRKKSQCFAFKVVTPNGFIVHQDVLPAIHVKFSRLFIPPLVEAGSEKVSGSDVLHWVITEWQDGEDFNGLWNELLPHIAGGRALPIRTVDFVLELVEDLRSIKGANFRASGMRIENRKTLRASTDKLLRLAQAKGYMTLHQEEQAQRMLGPFFASVDNGELQLSNGDFNFRNFVERVDGRVALLDWDNARLSTFEMEHCIAVPWLMTWNNCSWQRMFLDTARERFSLDPDRWRSVLFIRALRRALTWRTNLLHIMPIQLNYALNTLSDERFSKYIWAPGPV